MKKFLLPLSLALILVAYPDFNLENNQVEARRGGGHRGGHMRGGRRGGRRGMRGRRGRRGMGRMRGMRGWGRRYGYGYGYGGWGGWARPHHRFRNYGWGGSNPYYAEGGGYGSNYLPNNTIDAGGSMYPAYSFNYMPSVPASITSSTWTSGTVSAVPIKTVEPKEPTEKIVYKSKFKLGPDADIIGDGMIAFHLEKDAFLLVDNKKLVVVDQKSGVPALELFPDEVLIWHLNQELEQQALGLKSASKAKSSLLDSPHVANSKEKESKLKKEIENINKSVSLLENARKKLGKVPDQIPGKEALPNENAIEIFASTWMQKDGNFIIARVKDGSYIYLDGRGTYKDSKKNPLKQAYPGKYETIVYKYLQKLIAESKDTTTKLKDDLDNIQWTIEKLKEELEIEYKDKDKSADTTDDELQESKRRINEAIRRSEHHFAAITNQIQSMPDEVKAAKKLIANLK